MSLYKVRIRKGDTVMVRSGKHKGKTGKVLKVHLDSNKVTVEGLNVFKKHRKPTQLQPQGGIFDINKPLPVSKVGLVTPGSKKPSRIGYKANKDGSKARIAKTTGREVKNG